MTETHAVTGRRFLSTTLIGAVVMFLTWCAVDYYVVQVLPFPDHFGDFDKHMLFGLPLCHFVFAMLRMRKSIVDSVSSVLAACLLAAVLVAFLGINFHFAIGGTL